MTFGETVQGTTVNDIEQKVFTFDGQIGQRVAFDGLDTVGRNVKLFSPTGNELISQTTDKDEGPVTLVESGVYRVVVSGQTGDFQFRILDRSRCATYDLRSKGKTAVYTPTLGIRKAEIDTPVLCLDLDAMESNIGKMVELCRRHGVNWRPHSKCHKSPEIARKLVAAGAIGATCAKLGEAEVLAEGGVRDLLIANIIVGPAKVERLVTVRRQADPIVCVDHIDQARPISAAMQAANLKLRVIIEIDIGLRRVGVLPGQGVLDLAQQLTRLPGIEFAGIMGYEGHLLRIADQAEKQAQITAALDLLVDSRRQLEAAGIPCPIVSCGGTGDYRQSVPHPGITEVQAGGLILMDAFYRHDCQVQDFQYALTILATIVSRPAPDRAIIDAGRKTMNMELLTPFVPNRPDIRITGLSAEHGILQLDATAQNLKIGDRLEFIAGYSDFTCVLHDAFYGFRGERLECIWPLAARGRLQ